MIQNEVAISKPAQNSAVRLCAAQIVREMLCLCFASHLTNIIHTLFLSLFPFPPLARSFAVLTSSLTCSVLPFLLLTLLLSFR